MEASKLEIISNEFQMDSIPRSSSESSSDDSDESEVLPDKEKDPNDNEWNFLRTGLA